LETLTKRRTIACILFIFDILTGKIDSTSLLASVRFNVSHYPLRTSEILRVDFHRTNYGMNEPLNNAVRKVNENFDLFDFNLTKDQFLTRLRSSLWTQFNSVDTVQKILLIFFDKNYYKNTEHGILTPKFKYRIKQHHVS
jgi:hypothetical protein